MKEIFIDKNDPYFNRPKAFYILVLSVFFFGGLIAYLFIPPERKILEVPVEKIKYVDRVVEKRVEVPIEKKLDITTDKIPHRESKVNSDLKYQTNWKYLQKGMSHEQVESFLGSPESRLIKSPDFEYWYYGVIPNDDRVVAFSLGAGEVVDWTIRSKFKKNWKYLQKGMSREQVESLLGSPESRLIKSPDFEYWYYGVIPEDDRIITFPMRDGGLVDWIIRN